MCVPGQFESLRAIKRPPDVLQYYDHLCLQIGNTALLHAAHQGHMDVVESLLTNGASVNLQNDVRTGFGDKEINYFACLFPS